MHERIFNENLKFDKFGSPDFEIQLNLFDFSLFVLRCCCRYAADDGAVTIFDATPCCAVPVFYENLHSLLSKIVGFLLGFNFGLLSISFM